MDTQQINEKYMNNTAKTLQTRPDIIELLDIVRDDPELIQATFTIIDILKNKKSVPMERLGFIPNQLRSFFDIKSKNGIVTFANFKIAAKEMISCPMKARA